MLKRIQIMEADIRSNLDRAIGYLLSLQSDEGYWVFDLEADTTIVSEYILLQRFLDRPIPPDLKDRLTRYLRGRQMPDGGWPLYEQGKADISASVKAYFALKVAGDSPDAPHMVEARKLILSLGGAAKANVFTRICLALYGQIPYRTLPAMPVEIMLLPRWFFFHMDKVSYWSRAVVIPLLILYALKPVCRLRHDEFIPELFVTQPDKLYHLDLFRAGAGFLKNAFIALDRVLKKVEPLIPVSVRKRAINRALEWTRAHMAGFGGNGGVYPAMANAVMALRVLGYPENDPDYVRGMKAIDDLLVHRGEVSFCQPCVSPIWDTCLALSATIEAGLPADSGAVAAAVRWLKKEQVLMKGDWSTKAPDLEPGGWAFQFENALYPDLDDTNMVLMALIRAGSLDNPEHREMISRGVNWVLGMQCSDGGWGAFDIDNCYLYLNNIPFADHGALLDPSTSDLTARCIELLASVGYPADFRPIARGLDFLRKEQEPFGGWFGRWGSNYLYGTWSVLSALARIGIDMQEPWVRKAVDWLKACQNPDGGWGETLYSYDDPSLAGSGYSTASQTAWALLGLLAAGEAESEAVQRGIQYLLDTQNEAGGWSEELFTGTGFPRVFYLRYHGYCVYFPLWALGVYRSTIAGRPTVLDEKRPRQPADLRLPFLGRA